MKIWKPLLQGIGAVTLAFCIWGCYDWTVEAMSEFRYPLGDPEAPFFRGAFWTMSAIDAILLVAIAFASFQLLRLKPKAAMLYSCLILASLAWAFAPGLLWGLPNGIGRSIASASGVGSMGTGPLMMFPIPFLYPLVSVVLVSVARKKLTSATLESASLQQEKGFPA